MRQVTVNKSRRRALQSLGLAAALPLSHFLARSGAAQEKLDEDDPLAKSLNYKHDASAVDAAKRSEDQFCYNCQLYQGESSEEWAPCSIFQNKLVAGNGWCSAWVKKTA